MDRRISVAALAATLAMASAGRVGDTSRSGPNQDVIRTAGSKHHHHHGGSAS